MLSALTIELSSLGFLGYLALAASAAVGLHLAEDEPVAKKNPPVQPDVPLGDGESVQPRVRVRPELHQLRMLFTALGGYVLLKGISLLLMWPAAQRAGLTFGMLARLFQFGFLYVALGWFALWQFLRWYAQRRKWLRLQDELVGADVTKILACIIMLRPLLYCVLQPAHGFPATAQTVLSLLLELTVAFFAIALFFARPYHPRRTLLSLCIAGGGMVALTIALAILEQVQ